MAGTARRPNACDSSGLGMTERTGVAIFGQQP